MDAEALKSNSFCIVSDCLVIRASSVRMVLHFADYIFCIWQLFCLFFFVCHPSYFPLFHFLLSFFLLILTLFFLLSLLSVSFSPINFWPLFHSPLSLWNLSITLNPTLNFVSPSPYSFPPGHSHPMDMPGRGLYDERDSGIARSGRLMRLGAKAWIDLHSMLLSALHFELHSHLFLSRPKWLRNREDQVLVRRWINNF